MLLLNSKLNSYRHCCGVVSKIFKSGFKSTVIMLSATSECFVVTAFNNIKATEGFLKVCIPGKVI